MSLSMHFASMARGQGLHTPGFGPAALGSPAYAEVMRRGQYRAARRDGLLAGRPIGGLRLDAATATRGDATMAAMTVEWGEYLHAKFRHLGSRFEDHLAGAKAAVEGFAHQVYGKPGARFDATVPMASQGLTYILPDVYRIEHPELMCWSEKILKIDRRIDPAANEYVWYETDNVGVAKAGSTYDITTIPMVNGPIASDNKGLIVPALVGYETNFMEPRRERFAASMGKPDFQIEMRKREACEESLAQFFDALWFGGDGPLGIDGLMNHPIVQTLPITGGTWATKTALAILDDLKTMVYSIPNRSLGNLGDLGKVRLILPPPQYQLLMAPMTAAGSASIMEYFLEFFRQKGGGVPAIEAEYRLEAANSYAYNGGPNILGGDTALILYQEGNMDKDPTFVLSQPIEVPAPVRTSGVGDVTYYHARGGGMKLPDARRMVYVTGL